MFIWALQCCRQWVRCCRYNDEWNMVPILEKLPSVCRKADFAQPPWIFLNSPRKMLGTQNKSEMYKQAKWISYCLLPPVSLSLFSLSAKEPTHSIGVLVLKSGHARSCLSSLFDTILGESLRLVLHQRRLRVRVQARIPQLAKLVDKMFENKTKQLSSL